jgi:phosphatidylglycerol:prolipoprotein diacylglycerol transferase
VALWTLFGGLLASRLAFISVNWAYYQRHWVEVFQVWQGGLSWPGALAGGLLALVVFALAIRTSLAELADGLAYLLLPLFVASWLGCWLSGCAYGQESAAWWALPAVDEWGAWLPRVPVQLVASLLAVAAFTLLEWGRSYLKRPGQMGSLTLLVLAVLMAGMSLLRVDPVQSWHGLRLDVWASLFFTSLFLPSCVVSFLPRRQLSDPS